MAIVKTPLGDTLELIVQTGTDEGGNPVYQTRRFRNVKPEATEQDVFDVAAALAGLQQHTLSSVQIVESASLISQ